MYVVLANMSPDKMQELGIQDSFNKLVANGTFTADDAKKLADAQANSPTFWQHQYDSPRFPNAHYYNGLDPALVGRLINLLPDHQKGIAIKHAYAQESMIAAQRLKDEILSGKYSGPVLDQLTANLSALANNVDNLAMKFNDGRAQLLQPASYAGDRVCQ